MSASQLTYHSQVHLPDTPFPFSLVRYFFTLDVDEGTVGYAMVELFDNYDVGLYHASHGTLIVCQKPSTEDLLRIVPCTDIQASIALQKCPTSFGRDEWDDYYFVCEKMGPKLAWMEVDEEDDEPEER